MDTKVPYAPLAEPQLYQRKTMKHDDEERCIRYLFKST